LGVIANRVKERTIAYRQLTRFLDRLSIAVVGVLRDSQNYTRAAGSGLCIHEMPPSRVRRDIEQWSAVTQWLERRLATPLMPRDLLRPTDNKTPQKPGRLRTAVLIPVAAAMAMFAVSMWLWSAMRAPHFELPVDHTAMIEEETPLVSARNKLQRRWELSGVVQWDGSSLLIINDRYDQTTRRISKGVELDGWIITDTGPDYAVFAQNGEEVRLALHKKTVP
jgi:hypothetical protein